MKEHIMFKHLAILACLAGLPGCADMPELSLWGDYQPSYVTIGQPPASLWYVPPYAPPVQTYATYHTNCYTTPMGYGTVTRCN